MKGGQMYKIIGENNRVNYGCIDEPIEWNYEEFKLLDFLIKKSRGSKRNLHIINSIMLVSPPENILLVLLRWIWGICIMCLVLSIVKGRGLYLNLMINVLDYQKR